ncbi:imidazole glycerol phosphate synthase subunit HisH [Chitinibacter sp. GC72]|uniref:imidazole glycerol phosphate synthase subunit HisH n=1 Tax=Chitinibacter sp. GC72 TaxID=1526917 RepID=UPI0012FB4914|nr:imidazole glycerol phosphate synthase subunit HisH [Chitinibacter sp. GC72]
MKVLIVDYGMGNLASVARAIEVAGGRAMISLSPMDIKKASHIVLPGVGAFPDAMHALHHGGWVESLIEAFNVQCIPALGICLGMQLLADYGEEHGITPGLGIIGGRVCQMVPQAGERLPHVGWNEVIQVKQSELFARTEPSADYYFVHKYHFNAANQESILATSNYAGGFVSAIQREHVFGVQFHPEKSSKNGLQLIRNFLAMG